MRTLASVVASLGGANWRSVSLLRPVFVAAAALLLASCAASSSGRSDLAPQKIVVPNAATITLATLPDGTGAVRIDHLTSLSKTLEADMPDGSTQILASGAYMAQLRCNRGEPGASRVSGQAVDGQDREFFFFIETGASYVLDCKREASGAVFRFHPSEKKTLGAAAAGGAPPAAGSAPRPPTFRREYLRSIEQSINSSVRYPGTAINNGNEGSVTVEFHMKRDGAVLGGFVVQSSGQLPLDMEALVAIWQLGRVPPVPDDVAPNQRWFPMDVPVTYSLGGP